MERHEAFRIAAQARIEALEEFDRVLRGPTFIASFKCALESSRDRLHAALLELEEGDAAELYDDLYLPLFDALAYTTEAGYRLNGKGERTAIVHQVQRLIESAVKALDDVVASSITY